MCLNIDTAVETVMLVLWNDLHHVLFVRTRVCVCPAQWREVTDCE